jgi:hypothetical protein
LYRWLGGWRSERSSPGILENCALTLTGEKEMDERELSSTTEQRREFDEGEEWHLGKAWE